MDIYEILLMALSLSVDSLVVSMSGSVTLGRVRIPKVAAVAAVFGAVQAGLLISGWLIGTSVASLVHKAAHVIGFVILLYIGGSMVWSAFRKGSEEKVDLSGISRLLLAAAATSVDAFAVGVSLAMSSVKSYDMWILTFTVGAVTMAAATAGVTCGSIVGRRFGSPAKAVGGAVLVAIGVKLLCSGL